MRTFVYDDWNLIHETIYTIDGGTTNTTEVQYFWGLDLSGTIQGAGGVGGLLAVSRNGQLYFPTFDNNGNVTKYIDESGNVVAAYEYDDFGRTISQSGPLADFFRHRFSTKYYDPELIGVSGSTAIRMRKTAAIIYMHFAKMFLSILSIFWV